MRAEPQYVENENSLIIKVLYEKISIWKTLLLGPSKANDSITKILYTLIQINTSRGLECALTEGSDMNVM